MAIIQWMECLVDSVPCMYAKSSKWAKELLLYNSGLRTETLTPPGQAVSFRQCGQESKMFVSEKCGHPIEFEVPMLVV